MEIVPKLIEIFGRHIHPALFAVVAVGLLLLFNESTRAAAVFVIVFGVAFLAYGPILRIWASLSQRAGKAADTRRWRAKFNELPDHGKALLAYLLRRATTSIVLPLLDTSLLPLETSGFLHRIDEYNGGVKFELVDVASKWVRADYAWLIAAYDLSNDDLAKIANAERETLRFWTNRWMAG